MEAIIKKLYEINLNDRSYIGQNRLNKIESYISSLPYIITVGEVGAENSFTIFHADMPFNDDELRELSQNSNASLSKEQISHLTWWPRGEAKDSKSDRDSSSTLGFCGHNSTNMGHKCVREETNIVNLDQNNDHGLTLFTIPKGNIADAKVGLIGSASGIRRFYSNGRKELDQIRTYLKLKPPQKISIQTKGFFDNPIFKDMLIGLAVGLAIAAVITTLALTHGAAAPIILGMGSALAPGLGTTIGLVALNSLVIVFSMLSFTVAGALGRKFPGKSAQKTREKIHLDEREEKEVKQKDSRSLENSNLIIEESLEHNPVEENFAPSVTRSHVKSQGSKEIVTQNNHKSAGMFSIFINCFGCFTSKKEDERPDHHPKFK